MLISLGGKMPGALLPEHQAETSATAAATTTAGGGHDASSNGSDERSDEPGRHGDFQPALRQGGAWRNASPPNDGTRGNAKPCQCRAWQAWIQRSPQPECAGSRQKGILLLHIFLAHQGYNFPPIQPNLTRKSPSPIDCLRRCRRRLRTNR